jgi:nucleoid-associated protein YgaU
MHSIERYGIVALIFLVVTVVAVLLWDSGAKKKAATEGPLAVLSEPMSARDSAGAPGDASDESTLRMGARAGPRPLLRQELSTEPAGELPADQTEQRTGARVEAAVPEAAGARRGPIVAPPGLVPAAATRVPPPAGAPGAAERQDAARPERVNAPAPAGARYVVRASDTLSEIAQRELGSSRRWPEIQAANPGLDPARLRVGQTLVLPAGPRSAAAAPASAPRDGAPARGATAPSGARATWKVGPGESLWRIAERTLGNGKRWREIAALNPKVDPNKLVVGTLLAVPASAGQGKSAQPIVASARVDAPRGTTLAPDAGGSAPARSTRGSQAPRASRSIASSTEGRVR